MEGGSNAVPRDRVAIDVPGPVAAPGCTGRMRRFTRALPMRVAAGASFKTARPIALQDRRHWRFRD